MSLLMHRNTLVAIRVAFILAGLSFIFLMILIVSFGTNINTPIIFGIGVFFIAIAFVIKRGFVNTGKILLCSVPITITLITAILAKVFAKNFTDVLYYDARFVLLLFAVVPCLVFESREYLKLGGCLLFALSALLLFDPLHELMNVGYYQRGFTGASYYYINYVCVIVFLGISFASISLKRTIEWSERYNSKITSKLQETFSALEAQHEEVQAQQQKLLANQQKLEVANALIAQQKKVLEMQVMDANESLSSASKELIRHNNELRQFSYMISHNFRAPIARLLGLANLINIDKEVNISNDLRLMIEHISKSAAELDAMIADLNDVLDSKDRHQLRQQISFDDEFSKITKLLGLDEGFIRETFLLDFSELPHIYSARAPVSSIIYNLVSNALKYRSGKRPLKITVHTYSFNEYGVIEVMDNGIGIDLNLYRNDLFKMYKRFHKHLEGKGLGLYLVKSQTESLNGFVEVSSEVDKGTTFRVYLPANSAPDAEALTEGQHDKAAV